MRYPITLQAGIPSRLPFRGKFLQIVDTGVAPTVTVAIEWTGPQDAENFGAAADGFTLQTGAEFAGLQLESSVATTVDLVVSKIAAAVNAQPRGGAPSVPLFTSVRQADTMQDAPAVAVAAVAVLFLGALDNRVEFRVTNNGTDPVTIGAAGITWAKRTIVLAAGDTWIETTGAALEWWAICDAAKTASLNVQEFYT